MRRLYLACVWLLVLLIGITSSSQKAKITDYEDENKLINIESKADNNTYNEFVFNKPKEDKIKTITIKVNKMIEILGKEEVEEETEPTTSQDVVSDTGADKEYIEFHLSFYSSLGFENADYEGIDCHGNPLVTGTLANNHYKQGTRIYLEGFGECVVRDTGNDEFYDPNRLDVFVARNDGESDYAYHHRIYEMGRITVRGYLVDN